MLWVSSGSRAKASQAAAGSGQSSGRRHSRLQLHCRRQPRKPAEHAFIDQVALLGRDKQIQRRSGLLGTSAYGTSASLLAAVELGSERRWKLTFNVRVE